MRWGWTRRRAGGKPDGGAFRQGQRDGRSWLILNHRCKYDTLLVPSRSKYRRKYE
jgi:hypothetical protein